jgi:hypothetical protein
LSEEHPWPDGDGPGLVGFTSEPTLIIFLLLHALDEHLGISSLRRAKAGLILFGALLIP